MNRFSPSTVAVVGFGLAVLAACYDSSHLDAVAQLGPEAEGIPPGPTHRAGQPCTTCHEERGPAESVFSVAGTLYTVRGSKETLGEAKVHLTDASGDTRTAETNLTGNFFVRRTDWAPVFPLRVEIEKGDVKRRMITSIGRDGGCASCHRDNGDASYMPAIFLRDQ